MPARVRRVDEAAEIVRRAVHVRRRKEIDAVVAPAEASVELRDRHHLDDRDPEARQLRQLARRRRPRPLARERADVHLVDDLPFDATRPSTPASVQCRPRDRRSPTGRAGLRAETARRDPGYSFSSSIDPELIAVAGRRVGIGR